MKRNLIIWIILSTLTAYMPLKAQYFRVESVEGRVVKVHIESLSHQLRISCLQDTLLLYEYFGDYHARALNSNLLQITYAVRGGSGYGPENTAILAVQNGHLRQALLFMSSFESVGLKYHETLNTGMKLAGNGWSNYTLTISGRKYLRDKSHPSGVHKRFPPVLLRFNKDLMAFYCKTVVADSAFTAVEFNHSIEYMRFAAGDTLPVVKFAGDSYYYAEGSFYSPIDSRLFLQQDTVIDKLLNLAAVRQKGFRIDSLTRHRHGISIVMLKTADWPSDTGHYVLQVGYHSRHRFDAYYLFKVYRPDLAIKTLIETSPTGNQ